MDNFSPISAHFKQITGLKRLIKNGSSAGVFAFVGPSHLRVIDVAKAFGASHLGIDTNELALHPDVIIMTPEIKDSGKKAYNIEQMRDVLRHLSQSAMTGRRLLIIDESDYLNTQSQNALLKNLEEPSVGTTIILVAADETSLLQTIRSRVTTIHFFGQAPMASDALQSDVSRLYSLSAVDRLIAAQEIAKREAVDFDELFTAMASHLQITQRSTAENLQKILDARNRLTANGNCTIVLTELVV